MTEHIADLILSVVPEDGSSMGNGAMLVRLKDLMPGLSEERYFAARDDLIDQGVLGSGRGRGGSIYRADVKDFELTATTSDGHIPPLLGKHPTPSTGNTGIWSNPISRTDP